MYLLIRVACPTDISIYDKDGKLVAAIKDDMVAECAERVFVYTADAVKLAALPDGQEYTIKIDAVDNGIMNYSISEYDADMQNVRKVEYTNLPIHKGESYSGAVESEIGMEADSYSFSKNSQFFGNPMCFREISLLYSSINAFSGITNLEPHFSGTG